MSPSPVHPDAVAELAERLDEGNLDLDPRTRDRYGRDQSPFRRIPAAVLSARNADDVAAAVGAAAEVRLPVTARAGGSGVAGSALGDGLVIDTSALDEIEPADEESVWCGAGAVLDSVNERLGDERREIGPDVISSRWARIGGLVATNACGSRSLVHGRFGDALLEADVVLADGGAARLAPGRAPDALATSIEGAGAGLRDLEAWPDVPREPGGYRLPELAETGDAISVVPGSEGTLCVITRARLRTVPLVERRAITLAAFSVLGDALAAAPQLAATGATAVELLDARLTAAARAAGLDLLPADAGAALIVEHRGEPASEGPDRAARAATGAATVERLDDDDAALAWSLRGRALEAAGGELSPLACFEDPAVAPRDLPGFCDALLEVLGRFGFEALIYGHAAAGCVHVRPLCDTADTNLGIRLFDVAEAVCDTVGEWGGSLTGEHGWGLSRSYLAPRALGPEVYAGMEAVKRAFDPDGVLNPGIVVGGDDPRALVDPVPPAAA